MRCYLHIGTEKTGTSVLQEWLYFNRRSLSRAGYFLCKSTESPNNRKLCAYFQPRFDDYFRAHRISSDDDRKAYFSGFIEAFRKELKSARRKHYAVILTSEHFSSRLHQRHSIEALASELRQHFDEIRVICYVREQSQLRRSLYSTALRGGEVQDLDSFARDISERDHFYNYERMLGDWAAVFGQNNLRLGIYEQQNFYGGDLRKDFLKKIDFPRDYSGLRYDVDRANISLSRVQAMLIRLINQYSSGGTSNDTDRRLKEVSSEEILGNDLLAIGRLVSEADLDIYERFSACNRRFFRRFFNDDGNLFRQPEAPVTEFIVSHAQLNALDHELSKLMHSLLSLNHPQLPPNYLATDVEDINLFRDVALRYERDLPPTRGQAIRLMELARKARPHGPVINDFLRRHREGDRS